MNVVNSVEERERRGGVGRREGWVVDGWMVGKRKKEGWRKRRGAQHKYLL